MVRSPLRPVYVVAKKEFRTNLFSVRMAILVSILALVVVGASYGFSGITTVVPSTQQQLVMFVHVTDDGEKLGIAVFLSDAWGFPHADRRVDLHSINQQTGAETLLQTANTDGDGFVHFQALAEDFYSVTTPIDGASFGAPVPLKRDPMASNLSWDWTLFDLDESGVQDDMSIHFLDRTGQVPQGAVVELNGENVGQPDLRGFMQIKLQEGRNSINVAYGEETTNISIEVPSGPGPSDPFAAGPDGVLFVAAFAFGAVLLPIIAIALSYDSISKEKAQGSAELLLYRPASWRAIGMGKFLGIFVAVALPVTAVNLAAVLIITAITGKWPDATFAAGFIALSLFLITVYILLMQSLSTVARTAGTAILFGFLLWFIYNVLWGVVFFLVSSAAGISAASREYFVLSSYLGLLNPNSLYTSLVFLAVPESIAGTFLGQAVPFALPWWAAPVAAAIWIPALLILFLELYHRKAAG